MNNIIKYLDNENWMAIKLLIESDKINWNHLVDQTNGLIHYLAYHNQTDLIKLINKEILPEIITQSNTEGDTICHIAAKLNNIELLSLAISLNPKIIYYQNKLDYTPLYYLVINQKLIKDIVKSIKIIDHHLNKDYTLLEYYILEGNVNMISFLLKHLDLNKSNHYIFTILTSKQNVSTQIKMIELLLKYGININELNYQFLSPLIISIYLGKYRIIQFLLKNNANPNFYGPENNDHPLIIAINRGNVRLIELLLKYNIDVNVADKYLKTPLHYLFDENNKDDIINKIPINIKQLLVSKINNINLTDHRMNSIFNLLVHNDDWKLYEYVLEEKKLKIYLKNKNGISPFDGIKKNDLDSFYYLIYRSYLNQLESDINWADNIDKKVALMLENGDDIQSFKNYIMQKIIGGQSYPLIKKNDKSKIIKLINPPKTNITHFSAYTYNYICFLYYILQKYPEIKIPSLAPQQMKNKTLNQLYHEMIEDYQEDHADHAIFRSIIRDYINHSPILINHLIIWKNNHVYFFSPYIIQGIHETLVKYPKTKFILLKLSIINDQHFNHANILIYDVPNKIVERFDPYGTVPFINSEMIDILLRSFFKDFLPDIKYISPRELSDTISFQVFSDERNNITYVENDPIGFCMAWCLWYIEMRIKNTEIQPKLLIKKTIYQINKSVDQFKDYIRNYSNYLDYEKNMILEKANLPKKYWYMHHLPTSLYKAYLKYIRKIFADIV